ncbi:hypothetical protein BJX99DRAFT_250416 [Aspergillus californicus]
MDAMDPNDYTVVPARVGVVFDAQLSLDKLQESWYQTLEVRPIMQARVRRSKSAPSDLDYHVYTPRDMDFFCLDESHRSIADYCAGFGIGPSAPSHSYGTFVADVADSGESKRCQAFNAVQNLDAILDSDRPIAIIQVTRFKDATLITISVSHIMGDVFTVRPLFKGWESSLSGTPPAPFEQLGHDPFRAYGPGGELAGKDARFLSGFLWDCHIIRPEKTISQKYIFISEAEQQALEAQAKQDLSKIEKTQNGVVGQGPLTVTRIVNARARPPTGMKPQSKGDGFPKRYWYGAAMVASLPSLKVGKLMDMSLGELALHIKDGIREASTPENTRRFLAWTMYHSLWSKPTGKLALFKPPSHHWSGLTDWRLIRFHDIDFTPSRLDESGQRVVVSGFDSHMVTAATQRDFWVCFGKYPYLQRRASKL